MATANKKSGREQVAEFLNNLEHPLKSAIEEARTIILGANDQLGEHIKWNAPSFFIRNEDIVTFNLHRKEYFLLVFHCGAKVKERKEDGPLFHDETGLLSWAAKDRATVKFTGMDDVTAKRDQLKDVIAKWIEASQ